MKFVTDPIYGDHLRGVAHPERPARVEVVAARLRERGVMTHKLSARDATDQEILRVHTPEYLALVEREVCARATSGAPEGRALEERGYAELSTGDVVVDASSLRAARRAAGGAIAAVDACVESNEPVFALVRPPGHHAEPDRGMGFCIFNNAAIAARHYLETKHPERSDARSKDRRALVVDFDYHHGNGTEAVAGNGLSYVSTHAYPAYPGTGTRSYRVGADVVANVPLPSSGIPTGGFIAVWQELLPMVAAAVMPDILVVSAGFDYVAGDPVGDLGIGVEAAAALGRLIQSVARMHCAGRVTYVLEGGYDLEAIARSIELLSCDPEPVDGRQHPSHSNGLVTPSSRRALEQVASIL